MKKPRPYDGPVDWMLEALDRAASWTDATRAQVMVCFPYPAARMVRPKDWLVLVAHVCHRRGETPVACAERLASYCKTYAERHGAAPVPEKIKENHP